MKRNDEYCTDWGNVQHNVKCRAIIKRLGTGQVYPDANCTLRLQLLFSDNTKSTSTDQGVSYYTLEPSTFNIQHSAFNIDRPKNQLGHSVVDERTDGAIGIVKCYGAKLKLVPGNL